MEYSFHKSGVDVELRQEEGICWWRTTCLLNALYLYLAFQSSVSLLKPNTIFKCSVFIHLLGSFISIGNICLHNELSHLLLQIFYFCVVMLTFQHYKERDVE